jgi:hypothetical protein
MPRLNKSTKRIKSPSPDRAYSHTLAHTLLSIHFSPSLASGQRWLLTDGRIYDLWDLVVAWGSPATNGKWVRELPREEGVRALPRDHERLRRCLDSREFHRRSQGCASRLGEGTLGTVGRTEYSGAGDAGAVGLKKLRRRASYNTDDHMEPACHSPVHVKVVEAGRAVSAMLYEGFEVPTEDPERWRNAEIYRRLLEYNIDVKRRRGEKKELTRNHVCNFEPARTKASRS